KPRATEGSPGSKSAALDPLRHALYSPAPLPDRETLIMGRWLALLATLPMTGCFNGLLLTPTYVNCPVEETTICCAQRWLCRNKIALIDVDGMILNARSSGLLGSGENPVSLFRERLQAAADDCRVKAIVLRINSPGGAVTASDIMYRELLNFREKTG